MLCVQRTDMNARIETNRTLKRTRSHYRERITPCTLGGGRRGVFRNTYTTLNGRYKNNNNIVIIIYYTKDDDHYRGIQRYVSFAYIIHVKKHACIRWWPHTYRRVRVLQPCRRRLLSGRRARERIAAATQSPGGTYWTRGGHIPRLLRRRRIACRSLRARRYCRSAVTRAPARVKCARNQLPPCHRQHRLRCLHVCIKYNTEYSDQYRSAHPEVYTYATARPATSYRTRRQLNDRGICYIMYINSKNRASSTASAVCVPVIRKGSAL